MATTRDVWDFLLLAAGLIAAGATAFAAWQARSSAKASKEAILADSNRNKAGSLTEMHEIMAELQTMPLGGDLMPMNRGVERLRRLRSLSPLNLPKTDDVLAAYKRWDKEVLHTKDPRPSIPAALAEVEALVKELTQ